ncbi:transposase [Porphyromonas pogonae]|uniref:transposase n=2 Tax=Porphyromonas pogonae TaxID=867595 RepID=UPI0038B45C9F
MKKCNSYRYGYKKHVLTDTGGLIHEVITTAANVADTTQIIPLLRPLHSRQIASLLARFALGHLPEVNSLCTHS